MGRRSEQVLEAAAASPGSVVAGSSAHGFVGITICIDGKQNSLSPTGGEGRGDGAGPFRKLTTQLDAGPHTIMIRVDPKNLPPTLRLESSEGSFSTN